MTDLRTAAQQALEALTAHADLHSTMYLKIDAITALRAALVDGDNLSPGEPMQEPVAWLSTDSIGERYLCFTKPQDTDPIQPLYTAPQRKPLSEDEILSLFRTSGSPVEFARAVERAHGIGGGA